MPKKKPCRPWGPQGECVVRDGKAGYFFRQAHHARPRSPSIARANVDLRKTLSEKGLTFNETDPTAFRQVLAKTNFYKEWKGKFGDEAWGLLT